jgi:preprotein translocase subunit SecG
MAELFNIAIFVAIAVVAGILGWGLWNMLRGGDANLSQKLMRARVIAQFVALTLLLIAFFFFAPKG